MKAAVVLLVTWYAVHYGYEWAAVEHQGTVFNIMRSLGSLVLLGLIALAFQSRLTWLPIAGMAGEELQVVVCGSWWLWRPWPVKQGDELCSSGLGIPLGSIGLVLLGMVAGELYSKLRGKKNETRS